MLLAVSGSAPCPQDPGHGGIQGAGVSGLLVGQLLKEGVAWLVEPHVGFGVRSVGSGRVPACRTCVKRGSSSRKMSRSSSCKSPGLSADLVRVKFSQKCPGQERVEFAQKCPGQERVEFAQKCPGQVRVGL